MTTVEYRRPCKIEIGSESMEDTKRGYKSTTDIRGEIKVDPNVSLEDYSGPFKPDLRFTDFSREQLARMYLMACEYGFLIMEAYQAHIFEKYGFDAMLDVLAVWENEQFLAKCMDMKRRWMKIEGKDIESYMKDFQTDFTALPGKFYDVTFEMPSKDRGIMTFNRCVAVDIAEAIGTDGPMGEMLNKVCRVTCPPAMVVAARMHNPDIVVKELAIPPRKSKDDICCSWEYTYRSK